MIFILKVKKSPGRRKRSSPKQKKLEGEVLNIPRCSMYETFTYIWVVLGVNVGKYTSPMDHLLGGSSHLLSG